MALALHKEKGFTLIELLIVITIIGILAVSLVPRITGAQQRARDGGRQVDLGQYSTALEFYADDNSGDYYGSPGSAECLSGLPLSSYLTTMPSDPGADSVDDATCDGSTGGYIYYPLGSGSTADGYLLFAPIENVANSVDGENVFDAAGYNSVSSSASASTNLGTFSLCDASTSTACMYVVGR